MCGDGLWEERCCGGRGEGVGLAGRGGRRERSALGRELMGG